jgi:hypothetical protein
MLCLTTFCVRADVLLTPHPRGLIDVTFSDGLTADLSPFVHGPKWMGSWCLHGFMVSGTGADLFRDGQTILLPVRDTDRKTLEAYGQLKVDEKDPKALHFLYRFTAPEATRLNSAEVQLRLPVAGWAGQPLAAIEGPDCAGSLSKEPPNPGYLLNGQARGVLLGVGTPHEVWIELDAPHWCLVNDERAWNKRNDYYTVQLAALVAGEGTVLDAGQKVEITGTLHFAEPIKIAELPPIVPQLKDAAGWKAAVKALGLGIEDAAGAQVVGISMVNETAGGDMNFEPPLQMRGAEDEPGAVDVTGQIFGDPDHKTRLSVVRRITVPGEREMQVSEQVTAAGAIETRGVDTQLKLPRPLFDGCTVTFLNQGRPSVVLRDYGRKTQGFARALAPGIRIDAGGKTLFTLTCKPDTCWDVWMTPDAFYIFAGLLDPLAAMPLTLPNATTLHQDLTIHWGE